MTLNINTSRYKIIPKTTSHSLYYKLMCFLERENSLLGISYKLQIYDLHRSSEGLSCHHPYNCWVERWRMAEQTALQQNFHRGSLPNLTDQMRKKYYYTQNHQIPCMSGIKWHFSSSIIWLYCYLLPERERKRDHK